MPSDPSESSATPDQSSPRTNESTLGGPMAGKTVVITGATDGIGLATAKGLAAMGARVGIIGRNAEKTNAVAAQLTAESGAPVDPFVADLSSQAEVRRVAGELLAAYPRIDVLVNNVGGLWSHRHVTVDRLERTFALNHLAPFLLTNLLLDRLRASSPARVVTVSSGAHRQGKIVFEDLQGENSYWSMRAYSASKLANILFTRELARRLEGTGVTANAVHPGGVRTNFGKEDARPVTRAFGALVTLGMRSPARGAQTSIWLASSPEVEGVTGGYYADKKRRKTSSDAHDEELARRLWQVSAELVGLPL